MEWFHCNKCFIRRGSTFAVSTCGHICCEACIQSAKAAKCVICGSSCKYIPITDKMKPQDKMFFMDPVELLVSRLERILQITSFQQTQMERTMAYFKHKSVELEKCLKEVTQQSYRQIAELKRENADLKSQNMELQREMAELKKPLSLRGSPSPFQTNGVRRISLPVAVTPPVSAHSRTMSPLGPMWPRNRGLGLASRRVKVLDPSLLCLATALFFNMDTGPQFPTPHLQEAQAASSSIKWLLYQYTHLGINQTR